MKAGKLKACPLARSICAVQIKSGTAPAAKFEFTVGAEFCLITRN
jgi:hypothetical protein